MTVEADAGKRFEDDWHIWEAEEPDGGWLLTYVDVLSVILAMMVVLLGHFAARQTGPSSQPAAVQVAAAPAKAASGPAPLRAETPPPASAPKLAAPKMPAADKTMPEPTPHDPVAGAHMPTAEGATSAANAMATPRTGDTPVPKVATESTPTATPATATPSVTAPVAEPPEARLAEAVEAGFRGQVKAIRRPHGVSLAIADVILFESNRAELRDSARPVLARLAATLRTGGDAEIAVEGHTDDRPIQGGRFHSNWELAAARANAVTRFLIAQGLPPDRLRSISYAATRPVADNTSAAGRAENRRVDLRVEFLPTDKK